jgi:hypothetical protein
LHSVAAKYMLRTITGVEKWKFASAGSPHFLGFHWLLESGKAV